MGGRGGYRTSTSHALQGGNAQKRWRGHRTQLAMLRKQKSERPRSLLLSRGVPSRPSPAGSVQVPSRVPRGPVQIRHVLCFTAFRTHPGPEVGGMPARPGPILLPSVPSRIGPGRAKTQKNPRVRIFFVRSSGAGNGCANFMDAWKKPVRSAGKAMSTKFLVLGGGGDFGFLGGGGSADFTFMGARIFLKNRLLCHFRKKPDGAQ